MAPDHLMRPSRIIGWGSHLPAKIVTNDDLAKSLDTSDDWIVERTGIKERRIGTSTTDSATHAAEAAIARAGIDRSDIDLLVLATTTPDRMVPATASGLQHRLGLTCAAFDLNAACSGFVYAVLAGRGFLQQGFDTALVVGADTLSRITDWEDRNTAVLFGDGAGAVILQACDGREDSILSWSLKSDGSLEDLLYCDLGGKMQMNGREVYRRAVRIMVDTTNEVLEGASLSADDIDVVIPHQANIRIIEAACERLGIPSERAVEVLSFSGNTSAATVPLALVEAAEKGRLARGDRALLVGFGAGMTAAATIIRWDP